MVKLFEILKEISPTVELRKLCKKNHETLGNNLDAPFSIEGTDCKCNVPSCKRYAWNCNLWVHTQSKKLYAVKNRCIDGAKVEYGAVNLKVKYFYSLGTILTLLSYLPNFQVLIGSVGGSPWDFLIAHAIPF